MVRKTGSYYLTIEIQPSERWGRIVGQSSDAAYQKGEVVNLSVEANPGYVFINWEHEGETLSNAPELEFEMPEKNTTLTAHFGVGRTYYEDVPETELDETFINIMKKYGVVGITAAVVFDNSMLWSGSYGWHDIEEGTQMSNNSIIRTASISKSMTALAVMQLVDQGRVELDEDINAYLTDNIEELKVKIRNPHYPDKPITVKQLLNHTSSIRNGNYVNFNAASRHNYNIPTLDDYFGKDGKFYDEEANWQIYQPGEEFEYSNMGFVILGAIVESVSGRRFDAVITENVFAPLGMKNTSFNLNHLEPKLVTPMYKRQSDIPHFTKVTLRPVPEFEGYVLGTHGGIFGPQGSMWSTSEDLAKFMIAMICGDENLLAKEYMNEMHQRSVLTNKEGKATLGGIYKEKGLGIHITDEFIKGETMYGHPGGAYGIIANMYYTRKKEHNIGIVFMINGCNQKIFGQNSPYFAIEEEISKEMQALPKII